MPGQRENIYNSRAYESIGNKSKRILSSCNGEVKSVECHLHALMCSVSVVTVVFIHTMEDDQRLNTLVHEGDTPHFPLRHCKKTNLGNPRTVG